MSIIDRNALFVPHANNVIAPASLVVAGAAGIGPGM